MARFLCFIGEITVDFQNNLINDLSHICKEKGHEIVFCINFDVSYWNVIYGTYEKKSMFIPDVTQYDGIITCPDTYALDNMDKELSVYLRKYAKCPVVSVRVYDPNLYNILLDDYPAMCNMVEHFITVHGMTRICFMTGRMELKDAQDRLKAYRDTMAKYNIPVNDETMIFYGDYWRDKGNDAVNFFLEKNKTMPEAIVCSNDYMAISVCNALADRNIQVPDEISVSGLDDVEETRYHIPQLSSISAPTDKIAKNAIDLFEKVLAGETPDQITKIPLELQIRNSCQCHKRIDWKPLQLSLSKLLNIKELYRSSLYFSPYLNLDFEDAENLDALFYSVFRIQNEKSYGTPSDLGEIYVCLFDDSESQNGHEEKNVFPDKVILKAIISKQLAVKNYDMQFDRADVVPKQFRKVGVPLFVFLLHCKDKCYGYLAIYDDNINTSQELLKTLVFSFGTALERISMYEENQQMQHFREQSYIDELTGISNRRSMERSIRKLYERLERTGESFCIMSVDMDGLKYINDNYGHMEGDEAIKALASILASNLPQYGVASRSGGDEFTVLFPSENEEDAVNYIASVKNSINEFNASAGKVYELSASEGYEYCREGMNLLTCIHSADQKMYAIKSTKKNARK